jgi:predicted PurR-regulated permease PerM
MQRRARPDRGLLVMLALVSVAFVAIVLPFYGALMWAAVLALLFGSLQQRLCVRLGGRPGWAAFVTLAIVTVVVVLPLALLSVALAREATDLARSVQSGRFDVLAAMRHVLDLLPAPVRDLLERFGLGDTASIQQRVGEGAGRMAQAFAGHALAIGQGTLDFLVGLLVALYVAFFLLRDGRAIAAACWETLPLQAADKRELRERFATVVRATVKGNLVVAVVQGVLGGLALWFLDIPGALLWGAAMVVLSLLPAIGAAIVWGPIALYLFATGDVWQGVALTAFGGLVIGLVDNLLRPMLVGRDTRLPDWLILVSTIGAMALLGINGFVVGPVVASLFVSAWSIYGSRRRVDDGDG